ncbi:MAG: short-chain dehydrogenase [Acidobacteriales bacterium 59-55]|nr:SDR family oxidoreductase [Terriglobales bacterium]ODU54334.1 MAG: short-chain dehydrogenase [Granulicella sp. SCN 62-9]OJV43679.1 MAG: short-chain dehydrogenase [Acidobacteriales bacterium 59-55]
MGSNWTLADIPSQAGRRILITGANSGIGYQAAFTLARKGAHVILACRDRGKGETALRRLDREAPGTATELAILDLASLASVREFAARQLEHGQIDILINNAGVMAPPKRRETADGFELQFGTNVLGHFTLTGLLLPALRQAESEAGGAPRIVTIASIAHKRGQMDFDDPQSRRSYSPMGAYQQSKLANLMLALEMDRRLRSAGSKILSVAAHPGVAHTNLFQAGERSTVEVWARKVLGYGIGALLNTEAEGAIPTLYAATAGEAKGGGYYGPQGFQEMCGEEIGPAKISAQAEDAVAAARLWGICEELTGVAYL